MTYGASTKELPIERQETLHHLNSAMASIIQARWGLKGDLDEGSIETNLEQAFNDIVRARVRWNSGEK